MHCPLDGAALGRPLFCGESDARARAGRSCILVVVQLRVNLLSDKAWRWRSRTEYLVQGMTSTAGTIAFGKAAAHQDRNKKTDIAAINGLVHARAVALDKNTIPGNPCGCDAPPITLRCVPRDRRRTLSPLHSGERRPFGSWRNIGQQSQRRWQQQHPRRQHPPLLQRSIGRGPRFSG